MFCRDDRDLEILKSNRRLFERRTYGAHYLPMRFAVSLTHIIHFVGDRVYLASYSLLMCVCLYVNAMRPYIISLVLLGRHDHGQLACASCYAIMRVVYKHVILQHKPLLLWKFILIVVKLNIYNIVTNPTTCEPCNVMRPLISVYCIIGRQ